MFQSTFGAENYLTVVFHSEHLLTVFKIPKILHLSLKLAKKKTIFLSETLYSLKDTACKLKYSHKLPRRNVSLENLIEEPILLRL